MDELWLIKYRLVKIFYVFLFYLRIITSNIEIKYNMKGVVTNYSKIGGNFPSGNNVYVILVSSYFRWSKVWDAIDKTIIRLC